MEKLERKGRRSPTPAAVSVCAPFTDSAAAPGVASTRGITVTQLSVMSQSAWC